MSDEIQLNLANFKDRVGGRIEPGTYRVQVEDAEVSTSKAGNTMVTMWLRVVGGDSDGETVLDRLTLSDAALWRMVSFLQAIGIPTPRKNFKLNVRQFVGKVLMVEVDDGEPYNSRVKSEVRSYMKVTRKPQETTTDNGTDGLQEFAPQQEQEQETPETSSTDEDYAAVDLDKVDL